MIDATNAVVWYDGQGAVSYALVTVDGRIFNWQAGAWEPRPAAPLPAHLRPMVAARLGLANWSADVVPAVAPPSSQMVAILYAVDASGLPRAYVGSALLSAPILVTATVMPGA